MTTDDASTAGPEGRRRPAPTIDLQATEIPDKSQRKSWWPAWAASPSSGAVWRLIGAGAVGGLIVGAGFLLAGSMSRPDEDGGVVATRLAQVEQQVREAAGRPTSAGADPAAISALAGRLAKLESAVTGLRPATNDPALAGRIAAVEGEAKSLSEIVAILGRRSDETATAAREARQRADVNAAAIAELTQKIAARGAAPVERGELDALSKRIAAVENNEKTVAAELAKRTTEGTPDRSVRLAVAAAALRGAIERGEPFAPLLATVKPLAPDPKLLAPLESFAATGVPSAVALARELSELAPALYQAAGSPSPRENGILDRLAAGAEKLVRIRPIAEVPGTDPTAVIMRIEVKAVHADIAGALAELASLPANARAPAEAWIKKAQARAAAVEASQRVATEALASLGK